MLFKNINVRTDCPVGSSRGAPTKGDNETRLLYFTVQVPLLSLLFRTFFCTFSPFLLNRDLLFSRAGTDASTLLLVLLWHELQTRTQTHALPQSRHRRDFFNSTCLIFKRTKWSGSHWCLRGSLLHIEVCPFAKCSVSVSRTHSSRAHRKCKFKRRGGGA